MTYTLRTIPAPVSHTTALRCEVFPLSWQSSRAVHLRREDAPAWWIAPPPRIDPSQVVRDALAEALGAPGLVHSTSWRFDEAQHTLVLTYLAILAPVSPPPGFVAEPLPDGDVLRHGLRHFALLRIVDPAIAAALPPCWHDLLAELHPLPAGLLHHYDELRDALSALTRP